MKYLLIFGLFLCSSAFAQSDQIAYDRVVSIMKADFNYDYEAEVNTVKTVDLTKPAAQRTSETKMAPLVLLNGNAVKMNSLKDYSAEAIEEVKVHQSGSKEAKVYGDTAAKRAVINIIL